MRSGTTLGERYTLGERLGAGDTGTVWAAHDTIFDRPVTVKILAPELAADDSLRERFRHVALSVADLSIPGIVDVHDCLEERGDGGELLVCHVTERVAGRSLRALLTEHGAMPPDEALALLAATARALHVAHGQGVVHGNLKPENLIVDGDGDGVATVVDFGFRPPRRSPYTAPELSADAPAVDVYGLGAIVYECLTGRAPAADGDISPLLNDFDAADAAPIMKAMSSQANGRFASAAAFADACEHLEPVQHEQSGTDEPSPAAVTPVVAVAETPEDGNGGEPESPPAAADGETGPDADTGEPASATVTAAEPGPDPVEDSPPEPADVPDPVPDEGPSGVRPDSETAVVAATGPSDTDDPEPLDEAPETKRSLPLRALVIGAVVAVIAAVAVLIYVAAPTRPTGHERPDPTSEATDSPSQSSSPSPTGTAEPPNSAQPAPTSASPTPSDDPTSDDGRVQVPNVVGERRENAEARLSSLGLIVLVNSDGDGRWECRVENQDPVGGENVPEGSTVTIFVRRVNNPQQCIDPS